MVSRSSSLSSLSSVRRPRLYPSMNRLFFWRFFNQFILFICARYYCFIQVPAIDRVLFLSTLHADAVHILLDCVVLKEHKDLFGPWENLSCNSPWRPKASAVQDSFLFLYFIFFKNLYFGNHAPSELRRYHGDQQEAECVCSTSVRPCRQINRAAQA